MIEFAQVRTLLTMTIALSLAVITVLLWRQRPQIQPSHRGFDAVLGGLALVSAASLMDALAVESMASGIRLLRITVVVLQLSVGYLGGILCVGVGLSLWVPALVSARREEALRRTTEDALLTSRVESSTLHLANEIVRRLHSLTDASEITQEAVQVLIHQINAPSVAFYLLDEDGETLRLTAEHRFDRHVLEAGKRLPVHGSLSGLAVTSGNVAVSTDISRDTRIEPVVRRALIAGGFASVVIIPLTGTHSVLGTISLVFQDALDPTPTDLDTYRAIGQMVALAIENAHHRTDLEHRARHDLLTGLANRFGLRTLLDGYLRRNGASVGLIVFDVVRFMEINEALGYEVGDRLLQEIADRLRAAEGVTIGDAARLGGDEFAAICTDCASENDLEHRAHRLLGSLNEPYALHGFDLVIGLSVGSAMAPNDGDNGIELIRSADLALRHAKQTAGGVVRYRAGMMRTTPERLEITSTIRTAIEHNQLVLHYQPKFRLSDRRLIGFEALIRWQHPSRGLLPPMEFIPLAEMTDAIQPITRWVTHTALQQLARWQRRDPRLTMAVNFSARNLNGRDCGAAIRDIADDVGVTPGDVIVELTETALTPDPAAAEIALRRIADSGAHLAIDDFGTGYSSLTHLTRYPVHSLKIDQSFVATLLESQQSRAIIRSTVAMARDLGLITVAEGVESERIADELVKMGCDEAQGFALGRPMQAEEAERLLARSAN